MQEAWLRWSGADRTDVKEPARVPADRGVRGWRSTSSARPGSTREAYVGPWLPEPVATAAAGPLDTAELRDTVSLRDAAPDGAAVAAGAGGVRAARGVRAAVRPRSPRSSAPRWPTAGSCTTGPRRGSPRAGTGSGRRRTSTPELLTQFLDGGARRRPGGAHRAAARGRRGLERRRRPGPGRAAADPRPRQGGGVPGRADARYSYGAAGLGRGQRAPGDLDRVGSNLQLLAIDVREGRIQGLYSVLNPDKLQRVRPPS